MNTQSQRKRRKPGPVPRHGGYALLTKGTLPEKRRYVGHYLTAIREGLIHDLAANEEDLSTAQRVLIDRVITYLGVVRLVEEHARDHGLLDQRGHLKSGIGTPQYLSFNRHIKDCLALLGLKRIEPPGPAIADVIASFDKAKDAGHGPDEDGQAQASRQGEGGESGDERE